MNDIQAFMMKILILYHAPSIMPVLLPNLNSNDEWYSYIHRATSEAILQESHVFQLITFDAVK